jgi:hypothetical protein
VRLATRVGVSYERIRNAFKATVTLTWLDAGRLRPKGVLTTGCSRERRSKDARQACRRRLSKEKQAKGKARGRTRERTSKVSKSLTRRKVSKGKATADLASLRAGEALPQRQPPLQEA